MHDACLCSLWYSAVHAQLQCPLLGVHMGKHNLSPTRATAGALAAVSQRWTFDSQMRVHSNNPSLCLAADSCTANNCPVRLATCGSNDNQRWLVDSEQRLRPLNSATVCMELPSSAAAAGTAVRLWTCSTAASGFDNQRWSMTGEIRPCPTCVCSLMLFSVIQLYPEAWPHAAAPGGMPVRTRPSDGVSTDRYSSCSHTQR
jgi:hypothetical protein